MEIPQGILEKQPSITIQEVAEGALQAPPPQSVDANASESNAPQDPNNPTTEKPERKEEENLSPAEKEWRVLKARMEDERRKYTQSLRSQREAFALVDAFLEKYGEEGRLLAEDVLESIKYQKIRLEAGIRGLQAYKIQEEAEKEAEAAEQQIRQIEEEARQKRAEAERKWLAARKKQEEARQALLPEKRIDAAASTGATPKQHQQASMQGRLYAPRYQRDQIQMPWQKTASPPNEAELAEAERIRKARLNPSPDDYFVCYVCKWPDVKRGRECPNFKNHHLYKQK